MVYKWELVVTSIHLYQSVFMFPMIVVIHSMNNPSIKAPIVEFMAMLTSERHTAAGESPDSKVHGANMRPIWGRQDSGGPHVGPMNFAIWGGFTEFAWPQTHKALQGDIIFMPISMT